MAAGNVGATKANDLALGLDGFVVGGKRAGAVIVLFGRTTGVTTTGAGTPSAGQHGGRLPAASSLCVNAIDTQRHQVLTGPSTRSSGETQ